MKRDVDVNAAVNKVAEVFINLRDIKTNPMKVVDTTSGYDIWPQLAAQEFMHELMKQGDWHICHHGHGKDTSSDGT